MKLQDLNEKDIFKFLDSDQRYSLFSIEEHKITIQVLRGDKKIEIESSGKFSNYFDADIELLIKHKTNQIESCLELDTSFCGIIGEGKLLSNECLKREIEIAIDEEEIIHIAPK